MPQRFTATAPHTSGYLAAATRDPRWGAPVADVPGLAYERTPLGDFTETELVLLAALLNSGLRVRAHETEDAAFAQALTAWIRQAVADELRARHVTQGQVASALADRACARLLAEAKRG